MKKMICLICQMRKFDRLVSITDKIDVICNDEGKLKNFPMNRFFVDDAGGVWDLLVGNAMCVRHNKDCEFT